MMTDADLVKYETSINLGAVDPKMRPLMVEACRMSMGQLLLAVEAVEQVDTKKGAALRHLWNRRREMAELRASLATIAQCERSRT